MSNSISNRDGNRRVEKNRLIYYKQTADVHFWEDVWEKESSPEAYRHFQAGALFAFEKMFMRHLPRNGRILEAGCGVSHIVVALQARGFDCFGLDYTLRALRRARTAVHSLRLACGDITALGLANDSFSAIISIGVVEHRRAGPEPFLVEMRRVLKPDGVMLISVPYFNPLRRWRAWRGAYQDDVSGLEFYQQAFTKEEFCFYLQSAGFEIETTYTYAHQNTLNQELYWLKKIPASLRNILLRISKHIPYVNSRLGHMLMVIARKKKD